MTRCSCGSEDLVTEMGYLTCQACGTCIKDDCITSDTQFSSNKDGSSSIVGQYVGPDGQYSCFMKGINVGTSETTIQKNLRLGKEKIEEICYQLGRIPEQVKQQAYRFLMMIINKKVRRHEHSTAACIYLACRMNRQPILLIDFSDVLRVNVFELGRAYVRVAGDLNIQVQNRLIDPVIYLTRFCTHLDFGSFSKEVHDLALRFCKRMIKDWISYGRRPSGITGAAIILAGRAYGFDVEIDVVVKVAKVGHHTLKKRLMEFGATDSAALSIEKFMQIDLSAEANPPAFNNLSATLQRKHDGIVAQQTAEFERQVKVVSGQIDSEKAGNKAEEKGGDETTTAVAVVEANGGDKDKKDAAATASTGEMMELRFIHSEDPNKLATALCKTQKGGKRSKRCGGEQSMEQAEVITSAVVAATYHSDAAASCNVAGAGGAAVEGGGETSGDKSLAVIDPSSTEAMAPSSVAGLTDDMLGLEGNRHQKRREDIEKANLEHPQMEDGELDLTGIDDDEIDQMIMDPKAVAYKTKIWEEENGDYHQKIKEREERRRKEEERKKRRAIRTKRLPSTRTSQRELYKNSNTSAESIQKLIENRKLSSKIDYSRLAATLGDTAAPAIAAPVEDDADDSVPVFNRPKRKLGAIKNENHWLKRKRTLTRPDGAAGGAAASAAGNKPTTAITVVPSVPNCQPRVPYASVSDNPSSAPQVEVSVSEVDVKPRRDDDEKAEDESARVKSEQQANEADDDNEDESDEEEDDDDDEDIGSDSGKKSDKFWWQQQNQPPSDFEDEEY